CQHLTVQPYKNQVYRLAGLGDAHDLQPFDTAQKDEVLRLAYVAITRSARHCYWYIDESANTGDSTQMPKASDRIARDKPFFDDLRGKVQAG
ncbi:DNA helicase UvrD, partial [Pseudomonas syringae]|nr:DNA helicase UvrD [Pseudomonas syringae]